LFVCFHSLQKVEVPHLEEASDSEDDNDDDIGDDQLHKNGEVFQCDMVTFCVTYVLCFLSKNVFYANGLTVHLH